MHNIKKKNNAFANRGMFMHWLQTGSMFPACENTLLKSLHKKELCNYSATQIFLFNFKPRKSFCLSKHAKVYRKTYGSKILKVFAR